MLLIFVGLKIKTPASNPVKESDRRCVPEGLLLPREVSPDAHAGELLRIQSAQPDYRFVPVAIERFIRLKI
jgi:hypothetical protein